MSLSKLRTWLANSEGAYWVSFAFIGLLGFLLGLAAFPLFSLATLDDGTATLLGSALGAGITVAGSIWAANYVSRLQTSGFEKLVGSSVLAIRDEAYHLCSITDLEKWSDNDDYAGELKRRIETLSVAFSIFGQLAPYSEIKNYDARLSIFYLEKTIRDNIDLIKKEANWISEHPTSKVLESARRSLSEPIMRIFEACVGVGRDLGVRRELPSEKEIERRIGYLRVTHVQIEDDLS